jgi:hypothetical protein
MRLVRPVRRDRQRRAARSGKQQNAHDALAVHDLRVARDADARREARREMHEPRGGTCVQPERVGNLDGPCHHSHCSICNRAIDCRTAIVNCAIRSPKRTIADTPIDHQLEH